MTIMKILAITVVLLVISVLFLATRLLFKRESNLRGSCCQTALATEQGKSEGGCGCGGCGCGGGGNE